MDAFFKTEEYLTLKVIMDRLKLVVTKKNSDQYIKWKGKCEALCMKEYSNIGFDHETRDYRWSRLDINLYDIFEFYIDNLFHPNTKVYLSTQDDRMKVLHTEGSYKDVVIDYSLDEMKVCSKLGLEDMKVVHKRKLDGWEMILGGENGKNNT